MLVCLTAHQRTTPLESLERLSLIGDGIAPQLKAAHDGIRGAVVVSTCNRFEAYFDLVDGSPVPAMDAAMQQVADLAGLPFRTVRDTVDFAQGNRVARHLFAVAAGLDSVAVGEDEIAGQVRRALEAARKDGLTTAPLEHLFQRATETSRAVKNATRLGESGRSLVRLAVELAGSRVEDWATVRVLMVGSGRYAAASLAALRAVGAQDIRVHSRSGRRRFADREHLITVAAEDYAEEAAFADVVVTCTSTTSEYALTAEGHGAARSGVTAPQVIIDLGMPRNVDPGVRALPGIELLDLETIRVHAPIDEFATLDQAHEIVGAAARRHAMARRVHEVAPAVVDLRAHVVKLLADEVARHDSPEIEAALRHFSGVLLHGLIARGHTLAAGGDGAAWADAVRTVLPADEAADDAAHEAETGTDGTAR
ncbi:glutamyl-tRNA reductase [Microbacterium sp. W1N]|uniref:glutamyl-tRNA reductase n=1 Tax=Microbacterium festucae TaxID=2977531 RepID=UPI0021C066FF|nr:glutamyl-tRNA reductase [Microbacterium festucae]MCT9820617.1 glutamyl-tRNA reductase [Microbacterium festucae]